MASDAPHTCHMTASAVKRFRRNAPHAGQCEADLALMADIREATPQRDIIPVCSPASLLDPPEARKGWRLM